MKNLFIDFNIYKINTKHSIINRNKFDIKNELMYVIYNILTKDTFKNMRKR